MFYLLLFNIVTRRSLDAYDNHLAISAFNLLSYVVASFPQTTNHRAFFIFDAQRNPKSCSRRENSGPLVGLQALSVHSTTSDFLEK